MVDERKRRKFYLLDVRASTKVVCEREELFAAHSVREYLSSKYPDCLYLLVCGSSENIDAFIKFLEHGKK